MAIALAYVVHPSQMPNGMLNRHMHITRSRTSSPPLSLDIHRHDSILITVLQTFSVFEDVTKYSLFVFKHNEFLSSTLLIVEGSEISDVLLVEESPSEVLMRQSNGYFLIKLCNECVIYHPQALVLERPSVYKRKNGFWWNTVGWLVDVIYADPSLESDMQHTTSIYISAYVHVECSTS